MARLDATRVAVVAGGLVAATVLTAALAGPWRPTTRPDYRLDLDIGVPQRTEPPREEPRPVDGLRESGDMATWLKVVLFVLVLVAIALLGTYLARAARRWMAANRLPEVDRSDPGELVTGDLAVLARPAMAEGVDAATHALDRDVPPGDAVVAAWVALEDAAERTGVVREAAQTATEFTLELLDATEADADASRELLRLYLAARFSEHEITPRDVERARAALATIGAGVRRRRRDEDDADADQHDDDQHADDQRAGDEPAGGGPAAERAPDGPSGGGAR